MVPGRWSRVLAVSCVGLAACVLNFPPVTPPGDAGDAAETDGRSMPHCEGTCVACAHRPTQAECSEGDGCWWDPSPHCSGSCVDCEALSPQDCEAQIGCTVVDFSECWGSCRSCDKLTDQASCSAQLGCEWAANPCTGTPAACEDLSAQDCAAQPGCVWGGGSCDGTDFECEDVEDSSLCDDLACLWGGGNCWDMGMGETYHCSELTLSQCEHVDTCSWTGGTGCTGVPTPCEERSSQDECILGCAWHPCQGRCVPCDDLNDGTSCASQVGCEWDTDVSCDGSCVSCDALATSDQCDGQLGCAWSSSGGCTGTCTPCSSFHERDCCTAQPGCHWVE